MIRKSVVLSAALVTGALILTSACHSSAGAPVAESTGAQPATANSPPITASSNEPAPNAAPQAAPTFVVPAGTPIRVRLNSSLDTARSRPGDGFTGIVEAPVVVEGTVVVPKGANVEGVVRSSKSSGRFKGQAYLSLALDSIEIGGSAVPVVTDGFGVSSGGHKKRNLTLIGGGSGVGALIGGLAGGGGGALIGAGAGAAAGTAGAAITGKKQAHIAAESVLTFHLRQALQLQS